jgi:hypothetical protein
MAINERLEDLGTHARQRIHLMRDEMNFVNIPGRGHVPLGAHIRIGTNDLINRVLDHTAADVVRELAQNEFDAGGSECVIEFGDEALVVRGNGTPIDSKGWGRLSSIYGTGIVAGTAAGTAERIDPKTGLIGSKNFGMRSLFLFGDAIHVASAGKMALLHISMVTYEHPATDPSSAGAPGVVITVPYREVPYDRLPVFDEAKELKDLKTIATQLAPIVVKLAQPGHKNLRRVVVRSARHNRELWLDQNAQRVADDIVRRSIRVKGSRDLRGDTPNSISEIEYQTVVVPPPTQPEPDTGISDYFRAPDGGIRIGISARLRRRRLDLDANGLLYYPFAAAAARTGLPFSINAPFEMNTDRSNILDVGNSPWNEWLLEEAARFAVELLPTKLFSAYGADAYVAIDPRSAVPASEVCTFRDEIHKLLGTEECWPGEPVADGPPKLWSAGYLVVPESCVFKEFAAAAAPGIAAQMLHDQLWTHPEVNALALALAAGRRIRGGGKFTANSLIRMRCAGENDAHHPAARRVDKAGEADWNYGDFPDVLKSLPTQRAFAAALDAVPLRDEHITDLKAAPTTLTAAGTLAAAKDLWLIDETVADVITGVTPEDTLHPDLACYRIFRKLCPEFNLSDWAIRVSGKIADRTASPEECGALSTYLRGKPDLTEAAWSAVRKVPILPDRNGLAAAAAKMVSSKAEGVELLAAALHLPLPEDEENESLKPLKFRTELNSSDLVKFARLVAKGGAPASAMCEALKQLPQLLPSALEGLKGIRFVATPEGTLVAPGDSYVRSAAITAVLGDDALYAEGLPATLLSQLGARSEPKVDDIVAMLARWRGGGEPPSRPEGLEPVYQALAEALRRESMSAQKFRDQEILWTGGHWEAPDACLVGSDNSLRTFSGAVTVLPSDRHDVWIELGVPDMPTDDHWRRLLVWIGDTYGEIEVRPGIAERLRRTYRTLDGIPRGVPQDTRCLLDDHDRLHAISEAGAGCFLINDHPDLAEAAKKAKVPVAFAAVGKREESFFVAAGAKKLREVATARGYTWVESVRRSLPTNINLDRLRSQNFASAVAALVSKVSGKTVTGPKMAERFACIKEIAVADEVEECFELAGEHVCVPVPYAPEDNRIVVKPPDLRRAFADAVAHVADETHREMLGDTIYFLLECRSGAALQRELARKKIRWEPDDESEFDVDDEVEIEGEAAVFADDGALVESFARTVMDNALKEPVRVGRPAKKKKSAEPRAPRPPLPDIGDVNPRAAGPRSKPQQPGARARFDGGGGGQRDAQDRAESIEEGEVLGRRGEEIVLRRERDRVEKLGFSPDQVVWTADGNSLADHDIKSVDNNGADLWIEVKSTRGRDGRFRWSPGEFRLAVRVRQSYVLYLVNEADTDEPLVSKPIRDPLGEFVAGRLRLDLGHLSGDLGPLLNGAEGTDMTGSG